MTIIDIVDAIEANDGMMTLQHSILLDELPNFDPLSKKKRIGYLIFAKQEAVERLEYSIELLAKAKDAKVKTIASLKDYLAILEKR